MRLIPGKSTENLEKAFDDIKKVAAGSDRFLITFHSWQDNEIKHFWSTNDFPDGDLLICDGYLEKEFLNFLKKKTAQGRMDP